MSDPDRTTQGVHAWALWAGGSLQPERDMLGQRHFPLETVRSSESHDLGRPQVAHMCRYGRVLSQRGQQGIR